MKLFLAASFVLALIGLLAYTLWYRMHKRAIRRCKCWLPSGEVCGCQPERIGQIYSMLPEPPDGTHPAIDGPKKLAIVLTRCRKTGTTHLAKDEQKHIHPASCVWKRWNEPRAFDPDIELLLSAEETIKVVHLLDFILLSNGQRATSLIGPINRPGLTEDHRRLAELLARRQRHTIKSPLTKKPGLQGLLGTSPPGFGSSVA